MDEKMSDCAPVPEKLCEEKHKHMQEILDHRFEAMDDAVAARAKELERRLEGLNELREQVVSDRDEFLRKETYDLRVQYYDKYIDDTRITHQQLVNRVTVIETRSIVWTSVIGVAFTILQVLLHFFPRG
jgi:hypothetical protein